MGSRALLVVAGSGLMLAGPVWSATEAVSLSYEAPAECPARAELARRTGELLRRELLLDDRSLLRLEVRIEKAESEVRGSLELDDHGARSRREVTGGSCDEVVSALALAVALSIEPEALTRSEPPPSAVPPEAPVTPARAAARARDDAGAEPRSIAPSGVAGRSFAASMRGALGSEVVPGPFAMLGARADVRAGWARFGAGVAGLERGARNARYAALLAQGEVAFALVRDERIEVGLSLLLEAGAVRARGEDLANRETQVRPWAALGVGPFGRWVVLPPVFAELGAYGLAPLVRQRYLVTTPEGEFASVHETRWLTYRLELGLGTFL